MRSRSIFHKTRIAIVTMLGLALNVGSAAAQQSRVFATSEVYDGDLGGLAGADAKCQRLGAVVDSGAQWVAWLSTATQDAIDRLPTYSGPFIQVPGNGPWAQPSTAIIAQNKADLTGSLLLNAVGLNETGVPGEDRVVWTGTHPDGTKTQHLCTNWTSAAAQDSGTKGTFLPKLNKNAQGTDNRPYWTEDIYGNPSGTATCEQLASIYCFEVAAELPSSKLVEPSSGADVEVTEFTLNNDTGKVLTVTWLDYSGMPQNAGDPVSPGSAWRVTGGASTWESHWFGVYEGNQFVCSFQARQGRVAKMSALTACGL